MNKIELIKKDLEEGAGYNFYNWNKGDLQMLEEIAIATENVVKKLTIPVVISRLKERLEVNAGRLAEPLLKQGKQPKDDKDCHKAFLMLAHLAEIEDYLNGL